MAEKLPTKLGLEPIVDAICEVRFDADAMSAVDLLPGMFFEKFKKFDAIERTPIADIPQALLSEEGLQHQPYVRLRRENLYISIGRSMVSVSNLPPYQGWAKFSSFAFDVFSVLKGKEFIKSFTRISLRYTDIISVERGAGLDLLNADVRLGAHSSHDTFQVRTEQNYDDVKIISQIAGPGNSSDGRSGVVVDVDTMMNAPSDFWKDHPSSYEHLHDVNKRMFFSLLKPATIATLRPVY